MWDNYSADCHFFLIGWNFLLCDLSVVITWSCCCRIGYLSSDFVLVILCQRSLEYLWLSNNFTIVAGSNQGGNNLTLKGWPLTVSLSRHALCNGVPYALLVSYNVKLVNLCSRWIIWIGPWHMRGNCYLQMYVCMWFCCYCCVCWFFKSSFGYIFQIFFL